MVFSSFSRACCWLLFDDNEILSFWYECDAELCTHIFSFLFFLASSNNDTDKIHNTQTPRKQTLTPLQLHTKNIISKYATGLYLGSVQGTSLAPHPTASTPVLTVNEVAKHKTKNDCWIIIEGQVYNVTDFLNDHPGGKRAILMYGGKDATKEFKMLHNKSILKKYGKGLHLGPLVGVSGKPKMLPGPKL